MNIILSFAPVLILLVCLHLLDSYKLISPIQILRAIIYGLTAAALAFLINSVALDLLDGSLTYTDLVVPFIEEGLKFLLIFWLFSKSKIGFSADAAIYGFAIGSGFALAENLYYIMSFQETAIEFGAVRGLGTAVMHGSTTSLAAIITVFFYYKTERHEDLSYLLPGYLIAVIIHMLFNQFFITPMVTTIFTFTFFPITFIVVFYLNDKNIRGWMELELDSEASLLNALRVGEFSGTNAGKYFIKVRDRFNSETVVDLICYLQLYLELSIKAKGVMMMREAGFQPVIEAETKDKLTEFHSLRKRIGKMGVMALRPIVDVSEKGMWKLNQLNDKG